MLISSSLARRTMRLIVPGFACAILASCATKKEATSESPQAATAAEAPAKPMPTPAASPTPTPQPTPQTRIIARVSVSGGETTQTVLTPESEATPSPTPEAFPTPEASPTPEPPPAGNFLTQTWQKIFPPKAKPAPAEAAPDATPGPVQLKPKEGIFSRMWHMVFPVRELPPVAAPPQWIGSIKLVNDRDGYALIDSVGYFTLPVGETLNAVGNESETGVLRVTADRNPPFFIADIVSGKPRAGDRVYSPKP